mmetsp:Transcript_4817/g.17238  ORF Transcript_4817/g.17238 Transcript_4817/m.17238 type:complete len:288 (+) Transcript_4817:868-1731(+)
MNGAVAHPTAFRPSVRWSARSDTAWTVRAVRTHRSGARRGRGCDLRFVFFGFVVLRSSARDDDDLVVTGSPRACAPAAGRIVVVEVDAVGAFASSSAAAAAFASSWAAATADARGVPSSFTPSIARYSASGLSSSASSAAHPSFASVSDVIARASSSAASNVTARRARRALNFTLGEDASHRTSAGSVTLARYSTSSPPSSAFADARTASAREVETPYADRASTTSADTSRADVTPGRSRTTSNARPSPKTSPSTWTYEVVVDGESTRAGMLAGGGVAPPQARGASS